MEKKSHRRKGLAPKTLSFGEQKLLLDELSQHIRTEVSRQLAARNVTMALLMLDAGLRIGEVLNLRVFDLIVADKPIMSLVINPTISKCLDARTLPLTSRLHDSLYQLKNYWINPLGKKDRDMVFTQPKRNNHMALKSYALVLSQAAMKSIGRHVHPHMLRHTFATRVVSQTSTAIAKELLGHRWLSSTEVYCHPNQDDLKTAIDKIDQKR